MGNKKKRENKIRRVTMTTISLDMYQACALAALVYCLGRIMKQKLAFLDRYCIPAPVAGGVVFALLHLALYSAGILELTFDTTLQSVFMTIFFCIFLSKVMQQHLPSTERRFGIGRCLN